MSKKAAVFLMMTVSLAWGSSYLLMKIGLEGIDPFNLIGLRFGIAFLVMIALFFKKPKNIDRTILKYGFLMGLLLFPVFIGLVFGVKRTSASTAGFLASTTVILVPLFEGIIFKKIPHFSVIISALVAMIGLYFITVQDAIQLGLGAPFCIGAAACYAVYIIVVGKITKRFPASEVFSMSIIQLGVVSALGWLATCLFEKPTLPTSSNQLIAIILLGIVCSAYGFVAQPIAQKSLNPSEVGIIFSLEPLFSAALSFLVLGELLSGKEILGACLILSGVIVSQTLPHLHLKPLLGDKKQTLTNGKEE